MCKKMSIIKMLYVFAVGFYVAAGIYDLGDGCKKEAIGDGILAAGMAWLAALTND